MAPFRQGTKKPRFREAGVRRAEISSESQPNISALAAQTNTHGTSHQAILILDSSRMGVGFWRLSFPGRQPLKSFAVGTRKTRS